MNSFSADSDRVEAHYSHQDLGAAILQALVSAGKDPDRLTPEDLAPMDEFHIRGRQATLALAQKLTLTQGMQVLDVGSGIGGASRFLALEFGVRVTGLDLSEDYCRVASMLARRLGLDYLVRYRRGNALDMPFEDGSFDVLWTQHAGMNIPDKDSLYREMWRVLKPGGVLALYDVLAGTGGPVHYPVPWARDPGISFLPEPQQMREILEKSGFVIQSWRDETEEGRAWFRRMAGKISREGAPPLGIHVLLGPDFGAMASNLVRNLEEDRIVIIEAVVQRPVSPDAP
jgi:ubiquinone/menaquinone biosynthesis C-methylase UbiE